MSSVVGGNSNTSGEFYLTSSVLNPLIPKPTTTEPCEVSSSKDDNLNRNSSSKSFSSTSVISSPVAIPSQDNGGLKRNKSVRNPSSSGISVFDTGNLSQQNELLNNPNNLQIQVDKELCRFYEKNGFCRFGKNCRYSHAVPHPRHQERKPYVRQNSRTFRATRIEEPEDDSTPKDLPIDPRDGDRTEVICRLFSRKGYCRFGDSCRYSHEILEPNPSFADPGTAPGAETTLKECSEGNRNYSKTGESNSSKFDQGATARKPHKNCRYFSRTGKCAFGDRCKYLHVEPKKKPAPRENGSRIHREKFTSKIAKEPLKSTEVGSEEHNTEYQPQKEVYVLEQETKEQTESKIKLQEDVTENDETLEETLANEPKPVPLRNKTASEMTSDDFQKLRKTEINQLKRKYPQFKCISLPEGGCVFEVEFSPTDPDWRFDVKSVHLSIMIPDTYPEENLQVDCLNPEGILPEKLVRYFNKTTFTWLQDQHEKNEKGDRVELIFRPFLKWLDKSLEDIFISGLKMVKREMEAAAAGIQFVTHEELNAKHKSKEIATPSPSFSEPLPFEQDIPKTTYGTQYDEDEFPYGMENQSVMADQNLVNRSLLDTVRRGIEIKLRSLELLEGAGTLTCSKLTITVQCGRCKMRNDVGAMSHRGHRIDCEKCHHQQKLTFRPVVMHPFSSVAGYLDLDNCQVVDVPLLTCEFTVTCLPCGRQNSLTGLQYGQCQTTWCLFCHSKLAVSVESLKLNQLQPNTEPITNANQVVKLEKKDKKVKDPAIQEGKPLPENGTCKHYKKSFRWLRFPCCGKAYPCDLCHDEKETDHDMKLATRMICGFCAKEQVYSSDRPCVLCSSSLTKKSGTHWEGGKGCRDKIKMSRDDRQKYAGCNKTIPRKVQSVPKKEK